MRLDKNLFMSEAQALATAASDNVLDLKDCGDDLSRRLNVFAKIEGGAVATGVSMQAALVAESTDQSLVTQAMFWPELLGEQKTEMDKQHFYEADALKPVGPVSHVRVNMFPDGGISRVRIWGRLAR